MTLRHQHLRAAHIGRHHTVSISAGPAFMTDPTRACHDKNPELFYSAQDTEQMLARDICADCPFATVCATWAVDNGEQYGVWGGYLMSLAGERAAARRDLGLPNKDSQPAPEPEPQPAVKLTRKQATAALEENVRLLWEQGKDDISIALTLGVSHSGVHNVRTRLRLPAVKGPGGQRINRELVGA